MRILRLLALYDLVNYACKFYHRGANRCVVCVREREYTCAAVKVIFSSECYHVLVLVTQSMSDFGLQPRRMGEKDL